MIMIVGATLLLGGGGAGAFFFLMPQEPPDPEAVARAEAAAEDAADKAAEDNPFFVELDPLPVPITRNGRVQHYLYISLVVEVRDEPSRQVVHGIKPQLRAAMLQAASATALARLNDRYDPKRPEIELEAFAEQVRAEINTLTGKRTARRVLVKQVVPGPA
ncbi:flagellar basal body-associated FliL family protein [Zavarzinia sp. CC-PAN008]|uniref:flagellar basal body-associated FliL family protein n=1 Tax=Zavarzinia sp. CC-PAN008 TaxID=3243332 RepID=UPI003F74AC7C